MQLIEPIQEVESGLKHNLHIIADTLRNASDIKQGTGMLYNSDRDEMCAMGVLGFRSGIPKEDLRNSFGATGGKIWEKYGIDYNEVAKISLGYIPSKNPSRSKPYEYKMSSLYGLNDGGYSFEEIADYVDEAIKSL